MTLFGVVAHSQAAQAALRNQQVQSLASTFPRDRKAWWIDPQGRAALFGATVIGRRAIAVDSFRTINPRLFRNIDALAHTDGDFALASWDTAHGRLTLARDHFGQKQLYLSRREDVSLFCSDLAPLLEDPRWLRAMDFESAINYLAHGLPLRGRTLAKGIQSLPAAHALLWEPPAAPVVQRYWTPLTCHSDPPSEKRIRSALDTAIESRLAPNANALLLSGGVDSSYIAAKAATKKQLTSYTIAYDQRYKKNEDHFATAVSRKIGGRHVIVSINAKQAFSILQDVLKAPVPCSAWAAIIHQKLIARVSKRNEKTLLSGLGADELFGGYDRYLDYYFRQREFARRWKKSETIDWFDALLDSQEEAATRLFPGMASFFSPRELKRWLYQPFAKFDLNDFDREFYRECRRLKPNAQIFEMMIAHECQHRIPDLLMTNFEPVAQRMNVPAAYPFLDRRLVSYAALLRPSERYWYENGAWWAKKFFRQIAAELLPESIVMRRRATYEPPIVEWLQEPQFGPATVDRFASSSLWNIGFLRRTLKDDLVKLVRRLPGSYHTNRLWLEEFWAVLTLAAWYDRYIAR